MSRRSYISFGLVGAGIIALVVACVAMNKSRELTTILETANHRRGRARAICKAIAKRNDWLRERRKALESSLHQLQTAHPSAVPTNAQSLGRNPYLAVAGDPKLQNLRLNTFRSQLIFHFGAFYHAMGFTSEQIARFEDIQTEAQGRLQDIQLAALALGLTEKGPEIAPLVADNQKQLNDDLLTSLGNATYDSYQQYQNAAPERELLRDLSSNLLFTSSPLSAAQTQQLGQIMASARQTSPTDVPGTPSAFDFDQVESQAAAILEPTQAAELSAIISDTRRHQLEIQMMGIMRDWIQEDSRSSAH